MLDGFLDLWSLRELNPCPNWVLTPRSFTGLSYLILKAGTVPYPGRWDALVKS